MLSLLFLLLCITFTFRAHYRSTHGEISVGWWLDVGPDGFGVGRQLPAGRRAGRTASVVAAAAATQKVQQLRHRGQAQQQQHQKVQCRNWRLTSRCGISTRANYIVAYAIYNTSYNFKIMVKNVFSLSLDDTAFVFWRCDSQNEHSIIKSNLWKIDPENLLRIRYTYREWERKFRESVNG